MAKMSKLLSVMVLTSASKFHGCDRGSSKLQPNRNACQEEFFFHRETRNQRSAIHALVVKGSRPGSSEKNRFFWDVKTQWNAMQTATKKNRFLWDLKTHRTAMQTEMLTDAVTDRSIRFGSKFCDRLRSGG